jgi:hypothetical protein
MSFAHKGIPQHTNPDLWRSAFGFRACHGDESNLV